MTRKLPRFSIWVLGLLLFLAVFRDILANGRPLYCRIGGQAYFPGLRTILVPEETPFREPALRALQNQTNGFEVWKDPKNFDAPPVYAPIRFSPGENSSVNVDKFRKPGAVHTGLPDGFIHWLGTDSDGRDVAASIVSGSRIALLTGALAMLVALTAGLLLGMIAGYFGDNRIRIRVLHLALLTLGFPFAWFYAVIARDYQLRHGDFYKELLLSLMIGTVLLLVFPASAWFFKKSAFYKRKWVIPADLLIMRLAEIFSSIPRLILIISLAVAFGGLHGESIWLMIGLIGIFGWTSVARLVRAELLRVRSLDYIAAARGLGFPEWRILWRHALPNTLRPVFIVFAFGAASAVMLEAYLSFLGYGGNAFVGKSWGSLFINENSSSNPLETWWVTFFPGVMIFLTVFSLNKIGESLSDTK